MYRPKILYDAVALATAGTIVLGGCATRSQVRSLQEQIDRERQARVELTDILTKTEGRLTRAETRPLIEGPIEILKEKTPFEYGSVLGALLPKYKDKATKDKAEQYSNIISVSPLLLRGIYKVHVGRDHDGDGKLTPGSGDRTYPVDGKEEWSFIINEAELLQVLKDYMPNVRQYQPATAPPVERSPERPKPYLRRPINVRRQVSLPVKR